MRDGLVPEQRADRNGVVQTKWVRPAGAKPSRTSCIPVPAPRAERSAEWPLLISAEYDRFLKEHSYLSDSWALHIRDFRTALPELGSERATEVIALMRAVDDLPGHNALVMSLGTLITDSHRIHVDYGGPAVDNLLACIPRDKPEGKGFSKSAEMGVKVFEAHPKGDRRKPFSAEYAAACRSLAALLRDMRPRTFSAEDAVRVLPALVGQFDRFEPVMSELKRRGTFSREVAEEILAHGALGDGAL